MWIHSIETEVRSRDIEDILIHYNPYLQNCRNNIIAGLLKIPFSSVLAQFFEAGKMLRALLTFITASSVGSDPAEVTMAAEAIELLHGASLVHDDIIDGAVERRGRPALHIQVGVATALVLGDYLLLRSFNVLGEAQAVCQPQRVLEALNVLSHYAQECCRGQVEELVPLDHATSEDEYFFTVQRKTASQFAAAATVGGILGGGTLSEIDALSRYGQSLGTAYQIHDDMLDLVGQPRTLGKPVGISLAQERPMLPLIYLHKYGSLVAREEYRRLRLSGCDRLELVALLDQEKIFARVKATQEHYIAHALKALEDLHSSDEVEALQVVALYAITRQM